VVEQAVRVIRGAARDKSVSVRVFPDPADPVALIDERRTKQVLFNLLTNAVRYAPEGSSVDLTITQEEEEWLKVSVRDDGMGIDPADHERIFEEFVRVGPVADHPGGAGLGLPLSRRLVQLQGGEMRVDSALGTGSTFWFTVPVAHPPEEEAHVPARLAEANVGEYLN
jgi:signal transduction histidine kinase